MAKASGNLRPGLLIGGAKGGSGKTVVTLGLISALRQRGLVAGPFKKGPDYIDAAWLALAAGQPCHNLDSFLMPREAVDGSFARHHRGADVAVVEGNRGLHDGMDADGSHSSAEMAKQLGLPLVLVIDCTKMTRTAAALVLGCQLLDPEVKIGGVILNQLAGKRHEAVARDSIERHCHVPVLGAVPKIKELSFWERHLGLLPVAEHPDAAEAIEAIAAEVAPRLDIERLLELANQAAPLGANPETQTLPGEGRRPRIGVVRDAAFNFYYPENLQALEERGAELVEISALEDAALPPLEALYIGGGFPETNARALADNVSFRRSLRAAIEDGLPVYAECGGLTFLSQSIAVGGETFPMVGAFPTAFTIERKPQGHGYTICEIDRPNPFLPVGQLLRGHEFRYSRLLEAESGAVDTAFQMRRGTGFADGRDGICYKNVLATFCHVHALGAPSWARGLVEQARRRLPAEASAAQVRDADAG